MLSDELKAVMDKIDWKKGLQLHEEPVEGFEEAMEALSQEDFAEAVVYMRDAADKALGRTRHVVEPEEILSNQSFQVNRREKVKEKEYAVFPVVLMVEGVHHAVNGVPVFYPTETLEESVPHWEGQPIPVMHPNVDGTYVRANSPYVEEDWVVGRVYKIQMEGEKLKGEVWIDVQKAEDVSPGLIAQMESDKTEMEVSTGIFAKGDKTKGIWNGEEYEETIVHMIPDHLALLPGSTGACSWSDGCGIRANKRDDKKKVPEKLKNLFDNSKTFYRIKSNQGEPTMEKLDFAIFQLNKQPNEEAKLGLLSEMAHEFLGLRQMSFSEMEEPVRDAVRALNKASSGQEVISYHWALLVFPDSVIYEVEDSAGHKYFKRSYVRNDDGTVTLLDDAVEVKEKREFIPINNGESNMEKKPCCPEKVSALIANENTAFTEGDREFLGNMEEGQLDKLFHSITANAKVDDEFAALKAKNAELEAKLKANAGAEPKTAEDYIKQAPAEIAAILNAGKLELEKKRTGLVTSITANSRNTFTSEQLAGMDISQLEAIAALASPVEDYSGSPGGGHLLSNQEKETPLATTPLFPAQ